MRRSIRGSLQLWHAGILLMAVIGLGSTGYFEVQRARYREVDSQLEAAAQAMIGQLHTETIRPPWRDEPPMGPPDGFDAGPARTSPATTQEAVGSNGNGTDAPPRRRARPGMWHGHDGFDGPDGMDHGGFDDPNFGPPFDRPTETRLVKNIKLPDGFLQRYGGEDTDRRSFVIWRGDKVLKFWGEPVPMVELPAGSELPTGTAPKLVQQDDSHSVVIAGPMQSYVLAKGSVTSVRNQLRQLVLTLSCTGGAIVFLGISGGWVVSRHAVKPITKMSQTAGALTAADLSRRIDVGVVPKELVNLATVLNAAFDRLQVSFDRQVRFTADASHELRTPLAVIHSNAELSLMRPRSAEDYRGTLEKCLGAAKRMRSLVDSLLLLAHADAGELALDSRPVDLAVIAEEAMEMVMPAAVAADVELSSDVRPVRVVGDAVRLGQVVVNLIANAVRYNRPGGTVTVTVRCVEPVSSSDACTAELTISDTGVGIAPDDVGKVFDRFFRADKARSRQAGGSGLGLAICKSIVDAHRGTVDVTSELGVGTTFTLRLPRMPDPTESPAEEPAAQMA